MHYAVDPDRYQAHRCLAHQGQATELTYCFTKDSQARCQSPCELEIEVFQEGAARGEGSTIIVTRPDVSAQAVGAAQDALGRPEGHAGDMAEITIGGGEVVQPMGSHHRDVQGIVGEQPVALTDVTGPPELPTRHVDDTQRPPLQFEEDMSSFAQGRETLGMVPKIAQDLSGGQMESGAGLSTEQPVTDLSQDAHRGHPEHVTLPDAFQEASTRGAAAEKVFEENVGVNEEGRAGGQRLEPRHLRGEEVGFVSVDDGAGGARSDADDAARAAHWGPGDGDHELQMGVVSEGQGPSGSQDAPLINRINRLGRHEMVTPSGTITSTAEAVKPTPPEPPGLGRARPEVEGSQKGAARVEGVNETVRGVDRLRRAP